MTRLIPVGRSIHQKGIESDMRILYIDIDSLRPDHLGYYGYHRATSPNIDRLATEGVRFNQIYTPDAPCLPSRTALYSGRFGIQTGVVGHGGTAAQPKVEGGLSVAFAMLSMNTDWHANSRNSAFIQQ